MDLTSGRLLVATGVLHNAVGVAAGSGALPQAGLPPRNLFKDIWRDGAIAAIEPDPARMALFWFLMFGCVLMAWGAQIHSAERARAPLPTWSGFSLLGLGLIGVALVPVSGFWLVLPQALWMLLKSHRATRNEAGVSRLHG
jgi:hypothetical protein